VTGRGLAARDRSYQGLARGQRGRTDGAVSQKLAEVAADGAALQRPSRPMVPWLVKLGNMFLELYRRPRWGLSD